MSKNLTLEEYNALLAHCGCCPSPRCCPPLMECQSGFATVNFQGHLKTEDFSDGDSGSDGEIPMPPRYARKVLQNSEYDKIVEGDHPDGGKWITKTVSGGGVYRIIDEYSSMLDASVAGPYFSGSCYSEIPVLTSRCEWEGSNTEEEFALHLEDGEWVRYRFHKAVAEYFSADGERMPQHIAWEAAAAEWDAAHPDYETEHAQWVQDHAAYETAYQQYEVDLQEWIDSGEIGDPPVEPVEPQEPPPRPEEPDEFFPPCTAKRVTTHTWWERAKVNGSWVTKLSDGIVSPGNPDGLNPYIVTSYSSVSPLLNGPSKWDTLYEEPMTYATFKAQAFAWIAANAHRIFDHADDSVISESGSGCEPGDMCRARREVSPDTIKSSDPAVGRVHEDFFRYRFKLNKCCGYKKILSAWLEVFFPQEYLDWYASLAGLPSDQDPGPPPVDLESLAVKKQWLWEGIPPLCPENEDSVTSNDTDPFDHKPMWSPWSLVVRIPDGQVGVTVLRNFLQYCGPGLPDLMPQVTGEINFSDNEPDGP